MALTRGSRAETHLLSGMRRRVDSGLGRGLHPRHRAQSKPRASERPFAWARQDRRSTGDISHHDFGKCTCSLCWLPTHNNSITVQVDLRLPPCAPGRRPESLEHHRAIPVEIPLGWGLVRLVGRLRKESIFPKGCCHFRHPAPEIQAACDEANHCRYLTSSWLSRLEQEGALLRG
jgi:hypothetical protein